MAGDFICGLSWGVVVIPHLSDDETVAKMGHPIVEDEVRCGPPVLWLAERPNGIL